jgi:exodeoxyribonuclease VII large subunit
MSSRPILSVDDLCSRARDRLEAEFGSVWVSGEVFQLKVHSAGHLYVSLKGREASLNVVVFRGVARRLAFQVAEGQRWVVHGYLTVYAPQGKFQLVADDVALEGRGDLLEALERLKRKLAAEGLFDPARKRPIPALPRRIGLVTSRDGAAIRDFLRKVRERWPARVLLAPAAVQGERAPRELVAAIRALERVEDVDVIVLTRGGGSVEDLLAFSDEAVVRAVAACSKPVISAVGHEIDWVLTDFAADERAPTPTAAGERVVPRRRDVAEKLGRLGALLRERAGRRLAEAEARLRYLDRALAAPQRQLERMGRRLDDAERGLQDGMEAALEGRERVLERFGVMLGRHDPTRRLPEMSHLAEALGMRLQAALDRQAAALEADLRAMEARLAALDPTAVLARGYSITRLAASGRVLRDAAEAAPGAVLRTRLAQGELTSRVE